MDQEITQETAATRAPASTLSALSPDFLLFALPLAALLDVFGLISIFISFGVLGFFVSLVMGIPLVIWMIIREGEIENIQERMNEIKSPGANRQATQRRIQRSMARKGARKFLIKIVLGSLLVFLPYWLWSVFSILRKA